MKAILPCGNHGWIPCPGKAFSRRMPIFITGNSYPHPSHHIQLSGCVGNDDRSGCLIGSLPTLWLFVGWTKRLRAGILVGGGLSRSLAARLKNQEQLSGPGREYNATPL